MALLTTGAIAAAIAETDKNDDDDNHTHGKKSPQRHLHKIARVLLRRHKGAVFAKVNAVVVFIDPEKQSPHNSGED